MATLHYGLELTIELDDTATRQVMEAIAAHATRGGWAICVDTSGREWSFLVTAGIPIWISQRE